MKHDYSEWPYTPTLLDKDEINEKIEREAKIERELPMHWCLQKKRNGTCSTSQIILRS
jgi:hypothetical protein